MENRNRMRIAVLTGIVAGATALGASLLPINSKEVEQEQPAVIVAEATVERTIEVVPSDEELIDDAEVLIVDKADEPAIQSSTSNVDSKLSSANEEAASMSIDSFITSESIEPEVREDELEAENAEDFDEEMGEPIAPPEEIGPAVHYNEQTGMYESTDGDTWAPEDDGYQEANITLPPVTNDGQDDEPISDDESSEVRISVDPETGEITVTGMPEGTAKSCTTQDEDEPNLDGVSQEGEAPSIPPVMSIDGQSYVITGDGLVPYSTEEEYWNIANRYL